MPSAASLGSSLPSAESAIAETPAPFEYPPANYGTTGNLQSAP